MRVGWSLLALVFMAVQARAQSTAPMPPTAHQRPAWSIQSRTLSRSSNAPQGWRVHYKLRYEGDAPTALISGDLRVEVDGWVSNSRVPGHATPLRSSMRLEHPRIPSNQTQLIEARDEASRCSERATLQVYTDAAGASNPSPLMFAVAAGAGLDLISFYQEHDELYFTITLEHLHFLYGSQEPLLGTRDVTIRLGECVIRDQVECIGEAGAPAFGGAWRLWEPPADRADRRVFLTPPHSLYIAAHTPGLSYFRMQRAVPYGTRLRLSFWYQTGEGTASGAKLRLTQQRLGPGLWESLGDASRDSVLPESRCWTYCERVFRTHPLATSMTVEFRLDGDVGELWLDEVRVEPAGCDAAQP